ncbi:MAG: MerR family transcriptional regulator, partial [Alphaproteobacteria bacterium]|nr:MerR family transcriptional regulator [Alphaproteobacteria bacterium]
MAYTVKKLAKLSGVSARTLHWYDEIGLLKPAYYGANGYRYYEEEQLLLLQQILFFRELGFKLNDIQEMLTSNNFDKVRALHAHRHTLEESMGRTQELIHTINKTISHLKGEQTMEDKELYTGFGMEKQKEYEQFLVKYHGTVAEDLIHESKRRTIDWDKRDWDDVKQEGNKIYKALELCMDEGLTPRSDEVQAIIHKHYQMIERFYDVSKDVYMGLAQLYCEHPDFKKY